MKKHLVLIILFILILPSISFNALSQAGDQNNDPETLIHWLLKTRFDIGTKIPGISRWCVVQYKPPEAIQAYPNTINLKYLNETTIIIGGKNPRALDEWNTLVNVSGTWHWGWMSLSISYTFEFVPPENSPKDAWLVNFDPKTIIMYPNRKNMNWPGADLLFKTNLTLTLNPSADPYNPTQDVNIKVNVWREETSPSVLLLLIPPSFPLTHKDEYLKKAPPDQRGGYAFSPASKYLQWPLVGISLMLKNLQSKAYEKRLESVVNILVKVEKDHQVQIKAPEPIEIQPYEVKSIPVTIRNLGSHTDTFNFRINTTDKDMIISPPPAMTLNPGEEDQALIGVAAPKTFSSAGSVSSIILEVYSIEDPEKVFQNTITLRTRGIHFSEGNIYYGVLIFIILVIIVTFLLFLLRKRRAKICEKPDKPWEIPKEKEYLEKLKKENKKEYKKVIQMMKEEYESSLLWYNNYVRATIEQQKKEKQEAIQKEKEMIEQHRKEKQKAIQKEKKLKVKKEKEKKPIVPEEKKIPVKTEKVEKKPEEKPKRIDTEAIESERQKQKIILKIKREQEKQSKKFGF